MEKTTKELMEEKENYIKEMDRKIYESSQKSMRRNRELKEMRIADIRQWEDDGRPEGTFVAHQQWLLKPKPEPEIEPEPEPEPKPEHKPKVEEVIIEPISTMDLEREKEILEENLDTEKEDLKAQLELAKEKLALLEAAKKMEEPEEVEIIPEIEVDDQDAL